MYKIIKETSTNKPDKYFVERLCFSFLGLNIFSLVGETDGYGSSDIVGFDSLTKAEKWIVFDKASKRKNIVKREIVKIIE